MSNALTQEGRLTAATQTLTLSLAGDAGAMVQVADTFTGSLSFLATADGQNFVAMAGTPVGGGTGATTATVGGIWTFSVGGLLALRVSATALSAGAARVTMRAVEASGGGGGGGGGTALLPTAPLGQVLSSQGVGVQPIFTASPSVVGIIEGGTYRTQDGGSVIVTQGTVQTLFVELIARNFTAISAATPTIGTLAGVLDSTTSVPGATIVGGGTNNVLARYSTGGIWKVAAG